MSSIPTLIKRVLAYGITIHPYQLERIIDKYNMSKIPDDILNKFNKQQVEAYVNALDYASREWAGDWTKGNKMLKEMGFAEVRRECPKGGPRSFVSMQYVGEQ